MRHELHEQLFIERNKTNVKADPVPNFADLRHEQTAKAVGEAFSRWPRDSLSGRNWKATLSLVDRLIT